jgi:hypothetical protein
MSMAEGYREHLYQALDSYINSKRCPHAGRASAEGSSVLRGHYSYRSTSHAGNYKDDNNTGITRKTGTKQVGTPNLTPQGRPRPN